MIFHFFGRNDIQIFVEGNFVSGFVMNITILLRHSGIWESEVKYNQYKSDGIVVGENISYMNLISAIATELNIDELKKNIIIRYIIEGNSSPMIIRNDMGVKLFIEIKKQEVGFSMYPLCIDK